MKELTRHVKQQLYKIAGRYIPALAERGDLEGRGSDGEDFVEASVWGIADALTAAYELGQQNHKNNLEQDDINLLVSYILMTSKFREGERETWAQLSAELTAEGEPLFKHATENAQYWADLDKRILTIKEKLDRMY